MGQISVDVQSWQYPACIHLESMSGTRSGHQETRDIGVPINQPMSIRTIGIKAETSRDEILCCGKMREEFSVFRTKMRDLLSWDREGRLMRFEVERPGDAAVTGGVDIAFGMQGELYEPRRIGREAVERGSSVDCLHGYRFESVFALCYGIVTSHSGNILVFPHFLLSQLNISSALAGDPSVSLHVGGTNNEAYPVAITSGGAGL